MSTAAPVSALSRTCRALSSMLLCKAEARSLYLSSARRMEEAGLQVIAHAFLFTAAQEKEHIDILSGLSAAVCPVPENAALPGRDPRGCLENALRLEESTCVQLRGAAHIAMEEGFSRIATALNRIADTDLQHALRFRQYLDAWAEGRLFSAECSVSWLCLPCGELHPGQEPPGVCPACGGSQGGFIRSDHYPFAVEG